MILLTGAGALASEFQRQFPASEVVSIRYYLHHAPDALEKKISRAKAIIHNSGCISEADPTTLFQSNVDNTQKLVSIVNRTNPSIPFINISSMSILKTESELLPPSEIGPYAISKATAEPDTK